MEDPDWLEWRKLASFFDIYLSGSRDSHTFFLLLIIGDKCYQEKWSIVQQELKFGDCDGLEVSQDHRSRNCRFSPRSATYFYNESLNSS